jgi:hypothetical protein
MLLQQPLLSSLLPLLPPLLHLLEVLSTNTVSRNSSRPRRFLLHRVSGGCLACTQAALQLLVLPVPALVPPLALLLLPPLCTSLDCMAVLLTRPSHDRNWSCAAAVAAIWKASCWTAVAHFDFFFLWGHVAKQP